jgi:hypothetical protein
VFVAIAHDSAPEPRSTVGSLGSYFHSSPFFGIDVDGLAPGQAAVIDDTTLGYPFASLRGLPPGDYYVQAIAAVYTQVHRADGHTVWVHLDQWEGQHIANGPGNLVSAIQRVHLDPSHGYDVSLQLSRVLPPLSDPPDTRWIKHVRIKSELLSKFWGHPIYIGAAVLLPKDYDAHPSVRYPTLYEQTHFGQYRDNAPLGFSTDSVAIPPMIRTTLARYNRQVGYQLYKEWISPTMPRLIVVNSVEPTPYYDDSYAVNSANNGPYGDAIMTELIPYLEAHFRMIPKGYARVLTGGSTGGWRSLALQFYHPDDFSGTWSVAPDPVDFRDWSLVNIYGDSNAFATAQDVQIQSPVGEYLHPPRYWSRGVEGQPFLTNQLESQMEAVLGSHDRSGEQMAAWEATYGPVGDDGYPKPLWDKRTGHIDHQVANYMRDHGYDLRAYLAKNWAAIGPKLVDKVHVDVGDMDNYYLNLGVYDLAAFFDSTSSPHVKADFRYGRPEMGHGWQHASTATILREMAAAIARHAPPGERSYAWKY